MKASKHRRLRQGLTIFILGPQGSGKGTQASFLAKRHGFVHLEAGGMLRTAAHRRPQSAFTRRITRTMASGRLVPHAVILRLVQERLQSIRQHRGIIIDGAPRTVPEALKLLALLKKFGRVPDVVLALTITRSETLRRLARRWICKRCSRSFTMGKDIRSPKDVCPFCGGEIYQRDDDRSAAITKRLAIFMKQTRPVIAYFKRREMVKVIRGERPIPVIVRDIEAILHNL